MDDQTFLEVLVFLARDCILQALGPAIIEDLNQLRRVVQGVHQIVVDKLTEDLVNRLMPALVHLASMTTPDVVMLVKTVIVRVLCQLLCSAYVLSLQFFIPPRAVSRSVVLIVVSFQKVRLNTRLRLTRLRLNMIHACVSLH